MFQFLFKYPASAFSKGTLVLMGPWPRWILLLGLLGLAGALALSIWRGRGRLAKSVDKLRAAMLWSLQFATVAILLLLLWQPAISITALKPQQNIIAVVVDDSRSMGIADTGEAREQQAIRLLQSKLMPELSKRFQVRLYRLSDGVARIASSGQLHASGTATQIGTGLQQIADESATLPIGAVVLMSDGADNSGGIDLKTLNELRRRRLPVNTVGFGRDELTRDVEMESFDVPAHVLVNSRLQGQVGIRQNAFSGKRANLVITADGHTVASGEITLKGDREQIETVEFNAGKAGVRRLEARLDALPGEENLQNNRLTRIVAVDGTKRRILYVEGEPRWEYKFLRRAVEDDPAIEVVSMLRTTQNKIYRQGISNPNELADGFPSKPEDLFEYQGLILGSVESGFFTPAQQEAIKEFVDRRGAGLLFLGGRASLADGDYNAPPFAELLPLVLPRRKNTFQRKLVAAELTDEGKKSLICRIEDNPEDSVNHWDVLPYLADYQDPGTPKPGAVVLARTQVGSSRVPLLVTENYGRGRTAVFATGGSWRWRMQQPVADTSQQTFWRQLLRWTAGATPSRVVASTPNAQLEDTGKLQIRADVRDKDYNPASDADVRANVIGPDGSSHQVTLRPEPLTQGIYSADWNADKPGSYLTEVTAKRGTVELGRDVLTFQRENGVAENFHREQNRDLLQKLAEETGGHYYTPGDAGRLPDEIAFSQAGITTHETRDLWNMPVVFLALLMLRSAEWLLRRKWGLV
jgi:hypothetical protein